MKDFNIENFNEQLIIRFLNGQLSVEETDELNKWIESSPENLKTFRDYQKIWLVSSVSLPDSNFNTQKAWKKLTLEMHKPSYRQISNSRKRTRKIYLKFARIAAMVIAIFTIGVLASYFTLSKYLTTPGKEISEISVPKGSRSRIVLPDSSIVWLNADSKISYSNNFNRSERFIKLEGEAYFDVITNPRKPFVVSTSHMNIKATGTKFNVKAYPDEDAVSTTLVKGIVSVEIPGAERQLTYNLEPNQNLTYKPSDMSISRSETPERITEEIAEPETDIEPEADNELLLPARPKAIISLTSNIRPERYTSWKDETWIIEGETMADMAVMLGRRFNTRINIQTEELKPYRFTGKIMNETLEQVLEILSMTTPLKYSVGKGNVDWEIDADRKEEFDLIIES